MSIRIAKHTILCLYLTLALFGSSAFANDAMQGYSPEATQLASLLTNEEKAWLATAPKVTVALNHGFMPIEALSERGVFKGITIDLFDSLAQLLNIRFNYSTYTGNPQTETADIIPSIQNSASIKASNYELLPAPHYTFPYAIFTKKNNTSIKQLSDLSGKRVGIYRYGKLDAYLNKQVPNIKLTKVEIAEDAFAMFKSNAIDAYVGNATVVSYNAYIIGFHDFKEVDTLKENTYLSMAVNKDLPLLKSILQKALQVNAAKQQQILNNWAVRTDNQLLHLFYAVITLCLLFLGYLFYKSQTFKRAVKIQNQQSQAVIWQQANYDLLTQLPNRYMFHNELTTAMTNATINKQNLNLLFINLDQFKQVNEYYGHQVGDQILIEVATRLNRCLPKNSLCARLGGDEFTLLIKETTDMQAAIVTAEKILKQLAKPYHIAQHGIIVTASIGITHYPNDANNAEDLYRFSDQAMQEAKKLGRNRYQVFTESMWLANIERTELSEDIHLALAENQFELYFQPIINLKTNAIYKCEALIRWHHPKHGLTTPDKFIAIAESNGTIHQIGDWVFKQSVATAHQLREKFHAYFSVNVNVSPVQFHYQQNLRNWLVGMQTNQDAGDLIGIEITESLLLDPSEEIRNILMGLQQAGSKISIDDFGTGYSSLAYLRKFNIDYIKIDKAFVNNLATNRHDLALCEAIIEMSHKLGIRVVAEGVETEAQLQLLKTAGCDYVQGFYYAKALPYDEFTAYLLNYQHSLA